jgi:hypothetical protein
MSAPDIKAVAAAVASGYASLTPPTGYSAIRRATDTRPNAIPTFPIVTVAFDEGEEIIQPVVFTLRFTVRFWLSKKTGDQKRDDAAVLSWLGVLMVASLTTVNTAAVAAGNQVKSALGGAFRYFTDDYASTTDCFGIEFDVEVIIRDWPLT